MGRYGKKGAREGAKKPEKKIIEQEKDDSSEGEEAEVPDIEVKEDVELSKELDAGMNSETEDDTPAVKPKKVKDTKKEVSDKTEEAKKLAYDKDEESKTVFCGNIPNAPNVNETRIKDLFSEHGTIKSVRFRTEAGKKIFSKKIRKTCTSFLAYVVFEKEEDAQKSVKLNGYQLLENYLRVNMANNKKDAFSNKGTVFVGNLPFDALESEVHEYFSQVGGIEYVRKIANKGIAYVCFQKGVNISKALKLNDKPFKGRNLRISRCESKEKQDKKKMFKKDDRSGKVIRQKVQRPHKINDDAFMRGRSNNNPIIKKIKDTQKAKYNRFTDAQKVSKKELFRSGGSMDQKLREENREKSNKKLKFFGSKVAGVNENKSKKTKVSKSLKQQKVIAKKLKSAAARTFGKKA